MLFAGYQTVASTATSMIINLIQHPECFRKIEDELIEFGLLSDDRLNYSSDECFQDSADDGRSRENEDATSGCDVRGDINRNIKPSSASDHISSPDNMEDREISFELLSKLSYLEQVLKETLRVSPPILGGYRKALKTFQLGVSYVLHISELTTKPYVIRELNDLIARI